MTAHLPLPNGPQREEPIILRGSLTGDPDRVAAVLPLLELEAQAVAETVSVATAPTMTIEAAVATERAWGLDALRGLLLLAMNFAFTIPHWGPFPGWMYHMQVPAAEHAVFVEIAGLTWRDMLFPGFLFTMSAALPVVMSARLAKGMPYPLITWIALRRAALLLLFAMVIAHVNPYWTRDYSKTGNIASIIGLVVAFAFFVRPRRDWSPEHVKLLRWVAWAGVLSVLFLVPAWYGQSFSPERQDGIIASIAFLTVAATAVWLFTRTRPGLRLAILAAVVAARMAAPHVAWFGEIWYSTPAEWLYRPWYADLLIIAIPGTIAGDLLVSWMRQAAPRSSSGWSRGRLAAIAATALAFVPALLAGLYERRHPGITTAAVIGLAIALVWLCRAPVTGRDWVVTKLCCWAAVWLVGGMLVEPLEGGIKKEPQTLGYLVTMAGVGVASLTSLLIVLDGMRLGERWLRPLVLIGQNPLLAYVILTLGVLHVLWLAGLGTALTATWQEATLRGLLMVAIAGALVWLATRARLLWRA